MKLKNKKTGEIGELQITEKHCAVAIGNGTASCGIEIYSSLAELNEEWEDYEEPKEYWHIDTHGEIHNIFVESSYIYSEKAIGNYFETREEAERAVEKLKAWKRLKDMGFKIEGIRFRDNKNYIEWSISQKVRDDHFNAETFSDALHSLFGGEE